MNLIPAIVQDAQSLKVLMLGYMNNEALEKTLAEKRLHFLAEVKTVYGQKAKHQNIFCTWLILLLIAIMILF